MIFSAVRRRVFLAVLGSASALGAAAFVSSFIKVGEKPSLSVEVVAEKLSVPWSISFISGDEALFTERNGAVKLLTLSTGRVEEVGRFEVAAVGEGGLLGIETLRAGGKTIAYLYHSYREGGKIFNKVVRTIYSGGLQDPVEIISGIPGGTVHNGGRLKIGPDNLLYITTGEGGVPDLSQDTDSLGGKILRLLPDGGVPQDNPFKTPVYALGLRNPQGLAWHPETGRLYCTDHGPSGEGLRIAHDEVNLIKPGANYGWPIVIGDAGEEKYVKPVIHSGLETWAPSGCCFYTGRGNQEFRSSFFFAALRGRHLHRLVFDEEGYRVVLSEKLFDGQFGRLRDVVEGPDGNLYILTSNRDGRGSPAPDDDRIIRVTF